MPDNNIWRYIVESDATELVRLEARRQSVDIVACPAIVFEAMRGRNEELRDRLVETMTRGSWLRLMPEAYKEAEQVRQEVSRLHPEWLNSRPERSLWYQLKADWESGWWRRARNDTRNEAKRIIELDGNQITQARAESIGLRQHALELGTKFEKLSMEVKINFIQPIAGWDGEPFDAWRLGGLRRWFNALSHPDSTDGQWLSPWVASDSIQRRDDRWISMWTREVEANRLPLEWLRWAFEHVQATRAGNDGTPVDNQIATYLPECDIFITADKVFADCVEKVRPHAPIPLGRGVRVPGGHEAVEALIETISDIGT